ncbi:cobalamin/Fe3+-siderophore ABC transporter ATP-binding protein [Clostridiaceae bacterium 14S0207]|nr:cobalamin/Fe3+-siderophore ABC transporter ATP-binding protein [Clostridiaceae bacterium 14S0207]
MLKSKDLSVGYGKKIVVDGVNIEVLKGQVLCFLGANGAGKTTILRTVSALLEPIKGEVYLKEQNIKEINKKELAKKMALVLTNKFSGRLMTVYDIVAMGRYPHTDFWGHLSNEDNEKILDALKVVNADYLTERYFDELSDGEKQKILVARALVQEPEIIILDEPTTHLDIRHRLELIDILKKLSKEKGITVILSLHEIDIALKSCDKVVLVKEHKIIAYGAPEDVVDENIINNLYGLKDANFNNLLGSVELANTGINNVFVIGGCGFGASIYRAFTKGNIGVITGILHKNDIDYEIGRTMGIKMHTVEPFEKIGEQVFNTAVKSIDKVNLVIDSGCPIGTMNRKNLELITYALKANKKFFSFRGKDESLELYGASLSSKIKYLSSISSMMENYNEEFLHKK